MKELLRNDCLSSPHPIPLPMRGEGIQIATPVSTPVSPKGAREFVGIFIVGNHLITKGVAQKKISVDRFKTILLPFMCFDEQKAVANHLDEIFSILEQQELVISESLQKAESLRPSILKKTFSGQLVPQDPNDEPASVLLERLKAEKAANAKDGKKGKTKQTA